MRLARASWLLLLTAWALACGGRTDGYYGNGSVSDGGRAGLAGSSNEAGMSSRAGSANSAGNGTAGTSSMTDLCAEQRRLYVALRTQLIEDPFSIGCMTAADCSTFYDRTGCSPACGFSIPTSARRGIDDRLYAFAEMGCTECPALPEPPCDPSPPQCLMGRCR